MSGLRTFLAMLVVAAGCWSGASAFDASDFLSDAGGSDEPEIGTFLDDEVDTKPFDAMDSLDSVQSTRLRRKATQLQSEHQQNASEMERTCACIINKCGMVLRADREPSFVRRGDKWVDVNARSRMEIEADKKREKRARERAKRQEQICREWAKNRGNSDVQFLRQMAEINDELQRELEIEKHLRAQRDAERRRRILEAETYTREMIEEGKKQRETEFEASRSDDLLLRQERDAEHLAACQRAWNKGIDPCGCPSRPSSRQSGNHSGSCAQ